MMSRITLHLRKQARSREDDPDLQTYPLGTFSSVGAIRSRLRFTRTPPANQSTDPRMTVTVQESTVMHDDDGYLVSEPCSPALKSGGPGVEWFEMRPPAPVRLASGRIERPAREKNPELHFVV